MRSSFWLSALLGLAFLAGCETPSKKNTAQIPTVTVAATEEQLLMGKHRAQAISSRWTGEEKEKFGKRKFPYLAVRTLGLTPEQIASLGTRVRAPAEAACIVVWDVKGAKVIGTECFVTDSPPAKGTVAVFGGYTAEYQGSY